MLPELKRGENSWIIHHKDCPLPPNASGASIIEVFDRDFAAVLLAKGHTAIPIGEYLASLNERAEA